LAIKKSSHRFCFEVHRDIFAFPQYIIIVVLSLFVKVSLKKKNIIKNNNKKLFQFYKFDDIIVFELYLSSPAKPDGGCFYGDK